MNSIGERFKELREKHTQSEFAKILNIPQTTYSNYENNRNKPDFTVLNKISSQFSVSLEWLLFGKGGKYINNDKEAKETKDVIAKDSDDILMIPMVEAVLAAGTGSFEVSSSSDRKYAFRNDFLRRKGNIKDMVLMRVSGDSMEPRILDGDAVLIDQSQQQLMANGVYAVGFEDMVYLKKINATPNKLILSSFNKEYIPIEIDMSENMDDQVRIIGRVVWLSREL